MNQKQITFTDKTTGEVITGTVSEIADKLGISRKTMYKKLSTVTPKQDKFNCNPPTVTPKNSTVTPRPAPGQKNYVNTPYQENGKTKLDRQPCVRCSLPTYHTIKLDGKIVFQCFGSCTTPERIKPIAPDPSKIAYLNQIIKQLS